MKEKGLLIGEMASLFSVSIDTLRYYDKKNLLKPSRRSVKGYRLYTIRDISRMIAILFLRKIDVSMNEIKDSIDDYDLSDTYSYLKEKKEVLAHKISELQKMQIMIDKQLESIESLEDVSSGIVLEKKIKKRSVFIIKDNLNDHKAFNETSIIRDFISSSKLLNIPRDWYLSGKFGCVYSDFLKGDFSFVFFYDGYDKSADLYLREGTYSSIISRGTDSDTFKDIKEKTHRPIKTKAGNL